VLAVSNPDIVSLTDIGGLVGLNNGVIDESSSASEVMVVGDAALTAIANVGGLAGRNTNLVLDSLARGNVSASLVNGGTVSAVGGLLGLNAGDVDNSGLLNPSPVLGRQCHGDGFGEPGQPHIHPQPDWRPDWQQ
jgi:hypothetical protein